MSKKRQPAIFDPSGDLHSQITTLSRDYPAGHVVPSHCHDRDQLVYASRGVMTVRTAHGAWVVPTHRAVWIPATIPHTITMSGTVAMRTLYLKPRSARSLPRGCCVVQVSGLLRELVLHACTLGSLDRTIRWQGHLVQVIVNQLEAIRVVPLCSSRIRWTRERSESPRRSWTTRATDVRSGLSAEQRAPARGQ